MEEVLFILLLVIFFLLLSVKRSVNQKLKTLQDKIDALSAELKRARQMPSKLEAKPPVLEDDVIQSTFKKPAPVIPKEEAIKDPEIKKEEARKEETVII